MPNIRFTRFTDGETPLARWTRDSDGSRLVLYRRRLELIRAGERFTVMHGRRVNLDRAADYANGCGYRASHAYER